VSQKENKKVLQHPQLGHQGEFWHVSMRLSWKLYCQQISKWSIRAIAVVDGNTELITPHRGEFHHQKSVTYVWVSTQEQSCMMV